MEGKQIKKAFKIVIRAILAISLIFGASFIPKLSLKTYDMKLAEGSWINVYYEKEEAAALDVFKLAEEKAEYLTKKLGFNGKQDINIYIYDSQFRMQSKKYGLIIPLLGLDWYIGDNIGTDVILTSPANPGRMHDYDSVKNAVLHEMVHAYVSVLNPHIRLWLTEGMALYLSNGEPLNKDRLKHMKIPSYQDICTKNPIRFSNMGGYSFAHTYIEYLEKEYGWDSVMELIKTEDYKDTFGKTDKEIYDGWVNYISN